jgi:DNA repair protein RadC
MRPRERYLVHGPDTLPAYALLALVLGTGSAGRTPEEIGRALLEAFGGLPGLRAAPPGALARVPGVGPARAVRLHAALSLAARGEHAPHAPAVHTPESAAAVLAPRLRGLPHEELHALYLDRRGRIRHVRRISQGTDHCTLVDPRQVLQPAVQLGVPRVVVAHNHPSGDPTPSEPDLRVTRGLVAAAETLRLQLVDHLVVTDETFTSLAAMGAIRDHSPGAGLIAAPPLSPAG